MKNKRLVTAMMTMGMVAAISMTAFAAGWQKGDAGQWWQNDDGTWPANTWQWLDDDNDGIAECYYFDSDGYLLINGITPDGYTVDDNGAWVVDGMKQTQKTTKNSVTTIHCYIPSSKDDDKAGEQFRQAFDEWVKSLSTYTGEVVAAGGYTKRISNVALDIYRHTRQENAQKYQEESCFIHEREGYPIVSYVKYKDLPFIVWYGRDYGLKGFNEDEVARLEDISDNRNALIKDFSDPYDRMASEKELKSIGCITISGGIQFVDDPELGNLLIKFFDGYGGEITRVVLVLG